MKVIFRYTLYLLIFFILCIAIIDYIGMHTRLQNVERNAPYASLDTIQVYSLINAYRKEQGRQPMTVNPMLEQSARAKLYDMILEHYWSHNDKNGVEPWHFLKEQGYKYTFAGENLAHGFTSAQTLVDGWKASPGHNKNLLDTNFTEMGLSYMCGALQLNEQSSQENTCLVIMHYASK
jgi:uncharacterized protein YkwD